VRSPRAVRHWWGGDQFSAAPSWAFELAMGDRYARIPSLAIGCRELSAADWRILACIALHADGAGLSWPGMTIIAQMTGIRRQDVPRTIRRLEQFRLLRCEPGGPTSPNVYRLAFHNGAAVSATPPKGVRNPV